MEYKILCEKCKRPAEIERQEKNATVYKSECTNCGGKIKPIYD